MIEWSAVSVGYSGGATVGPVDLAVGDGEWLGLIGPNGAGKSTLLETAVGAVEHTGAVTLAGRPGRRGLDVAWMPQRPVLPESMGVAEYVILGRTPHLGLLGAESRHDIDVATSALSRLGLAEFARRPLGTLSGGEAQRAVLARALAQEAPVLLLDEPTANLDMGHALEVLELLDALRAREGLTVVTAEHDLTLAGRYADRLVLMSGGLVVADGAPDEVLTEPLLSAHYGADVKVLHDEQGPIVVPRRSANARADATD